jgi:transposase
MAQKVRQAQTKGDRKSRRKAAALSIAYPNAAGIDIGGAAHFVAVPPDRDATPVRQFRSFTPDLHQLADWLVECGVDIVAMESTGVYWIPLFEILDARGIKVLLVNARHVKGVTGRKSDVLDCQWLQQLMSYGLLRGAFRPEEQICVLRSYNRQRQQLIRGQAKQVQLMQKALTQMNIQLTNVLADIVGLTGQAILRAIVDGERDCRKLAKLRHWRVQAEEAEIAKSLAGNWREEHLFSLKQALAMFDAYAERLAECDAEIERTLWKLQRHTEELPPSQRRTHAKNSPKFDVRERVFGILGVDITAIPGVDITTALVLAAEVGPDFSRFPTVKHFTSWLGLCPGTKITGGKVISGRTMRSANRLAQALRVAAISLRSSKSSLGAYYRRMAGRMEKSKAIGAVAHKLARLIYLMITKGREYVEQGLLRYEARQRELALKNIAKRAAALGLRVVPVA